MIIPISAIIFLSSINDITSKWILSSISVQSIIEISVGVMIILAFLFKKRAMYNTKNVIVDKLTFYH